MYTNWKDSKNTQKFVEAVGAAKSIAEVARILGLKSVGGNYRTIKHHITRLELDTSHHLGQGWNRENYLLPNQMKHKASIKESLIRTYGHKCWQCNLTEWQNQPIPLELEHIDGNSNNNELDNLKILCCNCHAQTVTWRRRKSCSPIPTAEESGLSPVK